MRVSNCLVVRVHLRIIACTVVLALLLPSLALAGDDKAAPAAQAAPATANDSAADQSTALPDSPDATQSSTPTQSTSSAQSSRPAPPPSSQPQNQEPVGTAAAEVERTTGVAAATPAGTAIAPPKQRRVRMLVIKVSALLGAGVAIGTVAALSNGSPSHPPGSH